MSQDAVAQQLSEAASEGQLSQLRQLLQQGADATLADDKVKSNVHDLQSIGCSSDTVKSADTHCHGTLQGWTALHCIAGLKNSTMNQTYYKPLCSQIMRDLLHAGADIDATDNQVLIPPRGIKSECLPLHL